MSIDHSSFLFSSFADDPLNQSVPGHDHAAIGFALDAGASLVVPQVDTVAQAKHVISAAKFGARNSGTRSAPPFRFVPGVTDTSIDGSKTFHQNLNEQAAVIIQIESLEGINNLDDILTEVPQIDACWLGTLDCRVSMDLAGNGGMGGPEQEWQDAVATYERIMKKHNKPRAGFAFGPPEVMRSMGQKKSFVVTAADVVALAGMAENLSGAREVFTAQSSEDIKSTSNGLENGLSNGINHHETASA